LKCHALHMHAPHAGCSASSFIPEVGSAVLGLGWTHRH
jgi:hypothetical protein